MNAVNPVVLLGVGDGTAKGTQYAFPIDPVHTPFVPPTIQSEQEKPTQIFPLPKILHVLPVLVAGALVGIGVIFDATVGFIVGTLVGVLVGYADPVHSPRTQYPEQHSVPLPQEMLPSLQAGAGVFVGVGFTVALGVGVLVAVGFTVGLGVGVLVAVGFTVGFGVDVGEIRQQFGGSKSPPLFVQSVSVYPELYPEGQDTIVGFVVGVFVGIAVGILVGIADV